MSSYGGPDRILNEVRDKYIADGGHDNPEVRAWIERMIFLMIGSFQSFGIPKTLGKLLINVIRQSRKKEPVPGKTCGTCCHLDMPVRVDQKIGFCSTNDRCEYRKLSEPACEQWEGDTVPEAVEAEPVMPICPYCGENLTYWEAE